VAVHIVAIRDLEPGFEAKAAALAPVFGTTPAALAARLGAAGRGPVVVATAAEAASAARLAAAVDAAGFRSLLLAPEDLEVEAARFVARAPAFRDNTLALESRQGEVLLLECGSVALILRGTMDRSTLEAVTTRERKFSLGKALLTQGLAVTKSVEKTSLRSVGAREGFAHLYAPGQRPAVLRESELAYEAFGPLRQPSRAANFTVLVAELRRRCTGAAYDDRLLSRAGHLRLLGPTLPPEDYLDVAVTLLARTLT